MNAPPPGLVLPEFVKFIQDHVAVHYKEIDHGLRYVCKNCGQLIKEVTGHASIHAVEFGDQHAGFGEVKHFPIPYCPQCEGEPTVIRTCYHVPVFPQGAQVKLQA